MNKCIKNGNLLSFICSFLTLKDILKLSHCNKSLRNSLNPEDNNTINNIFFYFLIANFFENEYNFKNKKNLSGNLMKLSKNYKEFLIELNKSIHSCKNESIRKKVINCFRIHMFLPDLRKENVHLEYESSTIHLMFCYDMLFRTTCTYNYYGKYISKEYMLSDVNKNKGDKKNSEVSEIKILKEGLYFEEELKNFKNTFNEFMNNKEYKEILSLAIKYDFNNLDCKYKNMNNNNSNNEYNNIIYLLLWINHLFILYSDFVYYYIINYNNDSDEKTLLIEFVHKHNDIINCALLLNSNFDNINLIINNYIIYYSLFDDLNDKKIHLNLSPTSSDASTCSSSSETKSDIIERFSLYKLFFAIIKENVYNRLSELLTQKYKLLIKNYCKDLFEDSKIFEKKDYNEEEDEDDFIDPNQMDIDNINDDDCIPEEDENMEDLFEEKEPNSKELLENFINCEVDYMIDEYNANAINHSELKVTKGYENIEELLVNQFQESIKYYIKEGKSCSYIFSIIEKITKCNGNPNIILNSKNTLVLISRTKKNLMKACFELLFPIAIEDYEKSFNKHIKTNEKNEIELSLSENEINNIKFNYNLNDLSSDNRKKVVEIVEKEINSLNDILKEKCEKKVISDEKVKQMKNLVNDFAKSDGIPEVSLFKKMVWFYYRELGIYEEHNNLIISILKHKNTSQDKPSKDLYESKSLLNETTIARIN